MKGINFHDFGIRIDSVIGFQDISIRNGIDFLGFGTKHIISFQDFGIRGIRHKFRYTSSKNW